MADTQEIPLSPEDVEQYWNELDQCLRTDCQSHEAIDDALRSWLDITSKLRQLSAAEPSDHHLDHNIIACGEALISSELFVQNKDYIRQQIIHSLLQEDDTDSLHAIACLLLLDGHREETLFPRMIDEACFPRLLDLLRAKKGGDGYKGDPRLHRFLLHLLYEMSRMERLRPDDLELVDDGFIHYLFGLVEVVSDDMDDPYHYPTIRVLLVLNEQYMLASTDTVVDPSAPQAPQLTNRIIKCLSLHGPSFRTFGENIILLLNRETETSLQLLILKLLYLLFTTRATYEYFYTNDLRVLLDVIIRNLMDLPDEKQSLRHTYLRVLYPLLAHTQLSHPPHYKKNEVVRLLTILRGSQNAHFAPADETTLRLVDRMSKVSWLENDPVLSGGEVARKKLGISLSDSQTASSISVANVAGVMEKPGVQTPSRNGTDSYQDSTDMTASVEHVATAVVKKKKPVPVVPKHRHGVPFAKLGEALLHGNIKGNGNGVGNGNGEPKKIPPKAPPPRRRGKMNVVQHPPVDPIEETASDA